MSDPTGNGTKHTAKKKKMFTDKNTKNSSLMLKIETATTREDRHREQMDRLLSLKMFLQVNAVVSIKYIFKLIKRKLIQMKIKVNAICWYFTTF